MPDAPFAIFLSFIILRHFLYLFTFHYHCFAILLFRQASLLLFFSLAAFINTPLLIKIFCFHIINILITFALIFDICCLRLLIHYAHAGFLPLAAIEPRSVFRAAYFSSVFCRHF